MVVMLAACSSDPTVPFESFAAEAERAICDWAVRCQHVPDRATCLRLLDPKDYDSRRARDSIAAGLSVYDAEMGTRCIETTRDGFCLATPFSDSSCARTFVGTRAEGESCTSVRECQSGVCTIDDCPGQCCRGTCGPASSGEPPEPAGLGDACENHGDCEVSAYCETDRVCTKFPTEEGQRCLIGCARGDLFCDVQTLTCKRYGTLGESCDPTVPGSVPCDPAWAVCDGVCRHRPGLGERCNTIDRLCVPTTLCDGNICVARAVDGEPCENRRDCQKECDQGAGVCGPYSSCEN